MSDNITQTVQNASLGAGVATGIMNTITANATAISVLCTIGFGIVYAGCAIWNAYSNHKRNKVSKRAIIDSLIDEMRSEGCEQSVIDTMLRIARK
jgi:hypothetical protein